VICSQLSPDRIDAQIDETISYYRERNATWEWMVGPNSVADSLDISLLKHGMYVRGESIGMAIDLHTMSPEVTFAQNFRIILVEDDETLKIWAKTMVNGFGSPALYPAFVNLECSLGCRNPSYRHYLGLMDGQPVSTSALLLGEKVAGIYCVSTQPSARKMGIGAAITRHALREAQAMGYHIAVLQSSQMGRKVYQRLGFQEFSVLRGYSPAI
jgi:ribosomal protein S18 acetylase RimI-like enzyme